jgi:hypothetical protein
MGVKPALTLTEEYRLRAFEDKVLWVTFGPGREEAAGDGPRLRPVMFAKCYWDDQITDNGVGKACGTHGADERRVYNFGCEA